jgi:inhibitor of cysteine peptidase
MILLAATAVAGAAALSACGGSSAPPSPSPVVRTFTEAQNSKTVTASVGERFAVTLDENPTTGYAWALKLGPGLSLISDEYAGPSPSASPLMGAGGARTWVVRVDDAGTLTLTGVYARSWEAPTKSAASFSLTIEAR